MRDRDTVNRRKVLKNIGIGASGATLLGSPVLAGSSDPSPREKMNNLLQTANEIGNSEGLEARESFLNSEGASTATQSHDFEISEKSTDSSDSDDPTVSPDKVGCVEPSNCDADIEVGISISYSPYANEFAVTLSNRMRYVVGTTVGGEAPVDGLAVQWGEDEWKIPDRDQVGNAFDGDAHTEWDDGSWNKEGGAFRVNDAQMCDDSGGGVYETHWTPYEYSTVYLVQGTDHQDSSGVTASYVHTWSGGVNGFSVSYPFGISISGSATEHSEDLQTEPNGVDTLRVTEDDI